MRKYFDDKFYKLLEMPKGNFLRFLHHTTSDNIAQKIIQGGFRYYDSFYKTTDEIIVDEVYLNYWFQLRRAYGSIAVVIIIDEKVLDKVNNLIKQKEASLVDNFAVLSEIRPEEFEDDYLFTLSHYYIRGYYNINQNEVVYNRTFNPSFFDTKFRENIEFLKKIK